MVKSLYNKYKAIPLAAKAALWFVLCSVLQKCIAVVTIPIFTRIMSTEQYGIYTTYVSVYSIVVILCTLSMEKCAYINGISKLDNEEDKNQLAISLLSLSMVITGVVFLIFLFFQNSISSILALPNRLLLIMFVQILFVPSFTFWSTKQRYEYKYIKLVFFTLLMVVLNAALGIVFVISCSNDQAFGRVLSLVVVQAAFGFIFNFYYYIKAKKFFSFNNWKYYLSLQLPLLPHSLSLIILSSSDRIMINSINGSSAAAIYGVAYSAGYMVTILKDSISSAMTPWIYENIKKKNLMPIRSVTKSVMILVTLITFLFVCFAPEIVYLLAPSDYYEAVYVIPPVAASSFFIFLYNMFSNISFYFEETKKIMVASVVGAVLNLVLNWLCIPVFGYVAAGYTTLVCYMVLAIAHYFIMRSVCKKQLDGKVPFDLKYIIAISIGVLIITVSFSLVYSNAIIRYALLAACDLICTLYRKKVMHIFKEFRKR